MATIVISSIGSNSRDYTSVSAWISAKAGDFVTDDQIQKGELYNDSDFVLDSYVLFDGATTDTDHYWWLTTASGQMHNGTENTGVRFLLGDSSYGFLIRDTTILENIELDGQGQDHPAKNGKIGIYFDYGYSIVRNCIVHGMYTYKTYRGSGGIHYDESHCTAYNNIIYDIGSTTTGDYTGEAYGIDFQRYYTKCYNNTIYNIGAPNGTSDANSCGIRYGSNSAGNNYMENNISMGNTNVDFDETDEYVTCRNNLSSDGTAPGTNSLTNKTASDQFTDISSKDFSLKSGADAINAGYTQTIFDYDIIGEDRPQGTSWDIGAFEFVSSGAVTALKMAMMV